MNIEKHISNLLFEFECVVIPGFGGFISKAVSATIQPTQHLFSPPAKKIVFNANLKTNDGLLISHVAREEKITYAEAKSKVEKFADSCHKKLQNKETVNIDKVGSIFLDEEGNMQFKHDEKQNYNNDSFGLKSFISPPVRRDQYARPAVQVLQQQNQKTHINSIPQQPVSIQKVPYRVHRNIAVILILIGLGSIVFLKFNTVKNYYNNYASAIPFLYINPNDYLLSNANRIPTEKIYTFLEKYIHSSQSADTIKEKQPKADKETLAEKTTPALIENPVRENTTNIVEKKLTPTSLTTPSLKNRYYIIAGSFKVKHNANKLVRRLQRKGFDAQVLPRNKYGNYRVVYDAYPNLREAKRQLAFIRRRDNRMAWILSY